MKPHTAVRRFAALLHLSFILAMVHFSASLQRCNYGTRPGIWQFFAPHGSKWVILNSDCRLHNYLIDYFSNSTAEPLRFLYLGDSVDRGIVAMFCAQLGGVYISPAVLGLNHTEDRDALNHCINSTKYQAGQHFMLSVHLSGPYFEKHDSTNVIQRTVKAVKDYKEVYSAYPELVTLSSNLWDIARIMEYESRTYGLPESPQLPEDLLQSYMANMTTWLSHTMQLLPKETLLLYHTTAMVQYNSNTGLTAGARAYYIVQLNAAAREVASKLGIQVVDLEAMSIGLAWHQYLVDDKHPVYDFRAEVLNMYINMLHEHKTLQQQNQAHKYIRPRVV
mmetsp:Transcript_16434/g.35529  ORF Transcript_16434/g.35529 Transcript_16434/m.35529 type:complete len:334 (+) Transcript_16434:397-1398(+)|eukprot:CAMPEP_0202890594 /NCGR_PEP_ID=MMETSP1392-20130828/945_1 /ASSEMBLY_ACC=CAM_ASM_000868 /TAXON_ID=225041 /ORGANISM="Chlamydomonas chlamydogama, Strain SAG 11-48b" /LENGTH=333 /DNA_ID=CAMNT_0049574193 /DNA_START=337 /DNA_END=1338 /DNA_ORIENTATION=+